MAGSVVFFVRDHLLPEVAKILRVESKFAALKDDLERIQAFIPDVDRRAEDEEGYNTRVKQMIEACFRLEDVIDEYRILEEQQPSNPGCAALLCWPGDFIKTLFLRHRIGHEIQILESQVGEITRIHSYSQDQGAYSSRGNQNALLHSFRQAPLYLLETEVIGFEAPRYELVDWLVSGRADRTVISVVGMAGIGKTTLAKKVFDSREVIQHFDCSAWITVSNSYTVEDLLRNMLNQFYRQRNEDPQDIWRMDRESLIREMRNYLQGKRYVIFFDDVWNPHFWDEIQFAVIDDKTRSRILVTTRNMSVAVSCKKFSFVHIHEMQPLTQRESFELFCKKAFFDFDGCCPENLVSIAYETVRKCSGLPLAIVAVAGLLSTKYRDLFEWKMFSQNLSSEMEHNAHLSCIGKVISFSYHDLPFFLKPCLLYFGIYPKSCEVKVKRMIRQWIAEGFVQQDERNSLEKNAELYLIELINRSLIHVSSVGVDGKVKSCRVNDLIHDMILTKARDTSFCQSIEDGPPFSSGKITSRRLSVETASSHDLIMISSTESPSIRSLHFFTEEELPEYLLRLIPSIHKLLKVLDFESVRLEVVPENLGNLILMKYLSFRDTGIQSLPKSIGLLHNLETLDLRQTAVTKIPKEVTNFTKLRHLLGSRMSWTQLKDGIGGMTSLQTLSEVQIDNDEAGPIRALGNLTKMRKLSLIDAREQQVNDLCSSIDMMPDLEKLYIETEPKDAAIGLHFVSYPPCLQKLRLKAKLHNLPEWIPKLHNLVELTMSHSMLLDDPLQSLKDLPNLLLLNLAIDAYQGECLHFQQGGFQRLKELGLRYLHKLNSIIIDKGALHSLKELTLMSIPKLKTAPEGIQHLEQLEVLNIRFMPTESELRMTELTKDMNLRK